MAQNFVTDNPELEALFQRYERAPDSNVFAPLADACRKAGMLEEATEICDRGVKKHPRYASGYVVQGKCYYDLGRLDKAESAFRKVLELDGNNLVALKYIGLILAGRGEEEKAMDHFKHVLDLDPDNREIKSKIEDMDEEPLELRDVVDEEFEGESITLGDGDETSNELATKTLADIYAAQGYLDKAEKIYREILKTQPRNEYVQRRLSELSGDDREVDVKDWPTSERTEGEETTEDSPKALEDETPPEDETAGEIDPKAEPVSTPSQESPAAPAKKNKSAAHRRTADDEKSYQQFKRWLRNLSE